MEFNRLISLVLGFIVLILVFVWISNKFRANNSTTQTRQPTITIAPTTTVEKDQGAKWNPFAFLFNNKTPTPSPTKNSTKTETKNTEVISITPQTQINIIEGKGSAKEAVPATETTSATEETNITYNNKSVKKIPETGAATMLIPTLSLLLVGGIAIRKAS